MSSLFVWIIEWWVHLFCRHDDYDDEGDAAATDDDDDDD